MHRPLPPTRDALWERCCCLRANAEALIAGSRELRAQTAMLVDQLTEVRAHLAATRRRLAELAAHTRQRH